MSNNRLAVIMVACVNFAVFRKADFANRLVCASCLTTNTIGCFGVRVVCHASASMRSVAVTLPIPPIMSMFFGLFCIVISHVQTS